MLGKVKRKLGVEKRKAGIDKCGEGQTKEDGKL